MRQNFHNFDVIVIGGGRSAALTKRSFVRRYAPEPWMAEAGAPDEPWNGEPGARKWPPAGE
ncbi:hypothetical protein [Thermomonas sp.]|uniref:hypothetical protein n=1 Tax=Thermomonas sp. TaxID=1971895 RepID=UPI00260F5193|nr:hypothetical protein [Thermomonas sp.]MCO5055077.1 hypothetical protein [Thermomonas sp.]